jgi:hypothetical protein
MRRLMPAALAPVLAGALLAAGCRGGTVTVRGEVTLDGKPLEEGLITYVPVDGKAPNAAAIKGGKYRLEGARGAMRVQITAPVVTGQRKAYDTPDSPLIDVLGERVPEQYNTKTKLTATLEKGENVLNWELRSQ